MEWMVLGSAGTVGWNVGGNIALNSLGDPVKYNNHWMAYNMVKACNRWEGRQILKKAPMAY